MHIFSPAQCVGYIAFVLGVSAFLQKNDQRLKLLLATECLAYAVHFVLLGNLPASASTTISCIRTLVAIQTQSPYVAALAVIANVASGIAFAKGGTAWFPVIAACSGTIAMFLFRGIPMRLVLLSSTLLWLANNILSGSIGGTMLEATIAIVNITTIVRLLRSSSREGLVSSTGTVSAVES